VTSRWAIAVVSTLLAAVAGAGLFAASTADLQPYAPLAIGSIWLVPGLIAIGVLVGLANTEGLWAAGSMAAAAGVAAFLYGSAIAAPGMRVEPIRTTLINNGTVQGLVAFLLILIFGMIGVVGTLVVRSVTGRADL
jgi:hypothetical protein